VSKWQGEWELAASYFLTFIVADDYVWFDCPNFNHMITSFTSPTCACHTPNNMHAHMYTDVNTAMACN